MIHAKIKQFDCVVADAAQQVFAVLGQVEGGDLPLQDDFVGRAVGSRVPEADLLVVVAADDGGAGHVGAGRDEIVAARAGELRLDACPTPQVPNLQGAVVAAGDHFRWLAEELRRHDLAAVPRQCVLERRKRNASVRVFESGQPPTIGRFSRAHRTMRENRTNYASRALNEQINRREIRFSSADGRPILRRTRSRTRAHQIHSKAPMNLR